MEKYNFPLCCYSNGEIVVEGENVAYKDGEQFFVFVGSSNNFLELSELICKELEVNLTQFELKIKMKYPSVRGYKVVSLNNDRALKAMWASVYHSNAASMDLYVELIPIQQINGTSNVSLLHENASFSSMLSHVMRGDDPLSCVSLLANSVDQEQFDDDFDEYEEFVLRNGFDDEGDDLVTASAPNIEFARLCPIDEKLDNSLCDKGVKHHENDGEFSVNQTFTNKLVLSQFVRQYHIERNQVFKTPESKPHTVTYKCAREPFSCNWTLRASKKDVTNDVFTIVTYNGPHHSSCVVDAPPLDHPNMTNSFIAKHIRPLVETDIGVSIELLRTSISTQFNFTPCYMKVWHAKQRAIADLYGDWEESYALLPRYLDALKKSNPGTVVHFVNSPTTSPHIEQFDKVFWAFGPSIRGFKHCRPVITIDGTHLYGKFKGVLLMAIGVDANDQIFPLAFAIVDCESVDTWRWFMGCIRKYVTTREEICVISDRHVGIMQAMNEVGGGWKEPKAYHRYCMRHFASNINHNYKSVQLKSAFMSTACATKPSRFNQGMEKIGELNLGAKVVLESSKFEKWSLCHDGGRRYGIKTTNNSECFNGVLRNVRFLPITALVKATFFRLNCYFVQRREVASSMVREGYMWSAKVAPKLEENVTRAAKYRVTCFNAPIGEYEVRTRSGRLSSGGNVSHIVILSQRTCTCNKWQIFHYPCSHVMAVCRSFSISSNQYVDRYYSSTEYEKTYS